MEAGGYTYPSTDMKVGICSERLEFFSDTLKNLVEVDRRGGYFLQSDMELSLIHI